MRLFRNRLLPIVLVALPLLTAMAESRRRPQTQPPQGVASPAGVWKGVSVCLRGKPVCKDEVVVYHVALVPTNPGHFTIAANKIVDGQEEEMGVLDCRFEAAGASLECPMPPDKLPGTWRFRVSDTVLDGHLLVPQGPPFRRIHVQRVD